MTGLEEVDVAQLSQEDLKVLAAQILSLIQNPKNGIGKELFDSIISVVPQTCIETVVVDNIDDPTKTLLIWRNDPHYHGWHCPGGFIRFSDDFETTARKVVQRELGVGIKAVKDTGERYTHVDSRGHTIGLIYFVEIGGMPKDGKWFDRNSVLNAQIISGQQLWLLRVLGWR